MNIEFRHQINLKKENWRQGDQIRSNREIRGVVLIRSRAKLKEIKEKKVKSTQIRKIQRPRTEMQKALKWKDEY
jgi:hypothetical protein